MLKKLFLPAGMILSVILAALLPGLGSSIKAACGSSIFILIIFFVCGWQTKLDSVHFNRKFYLALVASGVLTLFIAPWAGFAVAKLCRLDALALTGLVVMASVPPTLSSGIVMTETAEGNVMLGVIMTVFYNLLGVLTMPVMLTWCLAAEKSIDANPVKMFCDLLLLVVLPFAAGFLIRKWSGRKLPSFCGYIPSVCVIILILSFFSSANRMFRSYPVDILLLAGAGSLVMRIGLMAILWGAGALLKLDQADRKAMIFTAGSKTLTIALAMLAILNAGEGPAIIPCMVFYFLQSMIDSILAGRMGVIARRKAQEQPQKQ